MTSSPESIPSPGNLNHSSKIVLCTEYKKDGSLVISSHYLHLYSFLFFARRSVLMPLSEIWPCFYRRNIWRFLSQLSQNLDHVLSSKREAVVSEKTKVVFVLLCRTVWMVHCSSADSSKWQHLQPPCCWLWESKRSQTHCHWSELGLQKPGWMFHEQGV